MSPPRCSPFRLSCCSTSVVRLAAQLLARPRRTQPCMAYTTRRSGLPGELVNTGMRAAGDLWRGLQAHRMSDQSTSRPGCATWLAPATPTERREPLPRFPLCPCRSHHSLGHHPFTIPHRGACAAGAGPSPTSRAHAVRTRRSLCWPGAAPSRATRFGFAGLMCRRRVGPAE